MTNSLNLTVPVFSAFFSINSVIASYVRSLNLFCYGCVILFLWYGNSPILVEKKLFANELFSLIGFYLFICNPVFTEKATTY